ncbi:globin domain-containing protein [Methylovorus menthalis]|uniref:globin domain-containing protein n=1 Tax=Methylovorus menthalis TaxID=1002227 RepID=UPI001E3A21D1|nr:globin domain-containing protein [Methylovorus menthalis]MCB4811126.1 globin domain-containing protein [Methylovorus menthalis]
MLSATARSYIDASVPVLREHGLAITTTFYSSMFAAHPELTNLFNMGNQANGSQQQSLAAAVFAYAANIDNAEALAPVVSRIVHKHAAVGLTPDHYPIVGEHLLGAIKTVLGDAATPALIDAWGEAYWLLANLLIDEEKKLYAKSGADAGTLTRLRVVKRVQESADIASYYLQTEDELSPGPFLPGQYITVEAQLDKERRQLRQYSLSDSTQQPWWRISVKRETENTGKPEGTVSNWLHTHILEGDFINVSKPFGDLQVDLSAGKPIALLSAGIGITPMLSILNTLRDLGSTRQILFSHGNRRAEQHILQDELEAAKRRLPGLIVERFYQIENALSSGDEVRPSAAWQPFLAEGEFYLCGPAGFMQQQRQYLLDAGVSADRLHREVFGPELLEHLL